MKLNFIPLPQLLCAIHEISGSLHLSKAVAQLTKKRWFTAFVLHKIV